MEFHKSKGQHILKNPQVVQAIVDKAGIKATGRSAPAVSCVGTFVGTISPNKFGIYELHVHIHAHLRTYILS
jgi:hypothetical protein